MDDGVRDVTLFKHPTAQLYLKKTPKKEKNVTACWTLPYVIMYITQLQGNIKQIHATFLPFKLSKKKEHK